MNVVDFKKPSSFKTENSLSLVLGLHFSVQKNNILWPMGGILLLFVGLFFSNLSLARAAGYVGTDYFVQDSWIINDINKNHTMKILLWLKDPNPKIKSQALRECNYILERLVNHPQAFISCGYAEKVLMKKGWLLPYYQKALRLHPQYPITHVQYGIYLNGLDKPKAGISSIENALLLDPKFKPAYIWLEKTYISMGQPEKAEEIRERAREKGVQLPIPSRP